MKINKLLSTALFALMCNLVFGQAFLVPTTYRGAFAPAPATMWTSGWTNFDPQNTTYPTANVTVNSNITSNTTWTTGNTYLLQGQIYVTSGATLTIQPGVKVLGDKASTGAALIITKGAKIHAVGTATSPIVFTSNQPKGSRALGDWGGVILLGKAHYNNNGGTGGNGTGNIEGIAASVLTEYGGGPAYDDDDNSGELQYVRIEFGGYVYQPNKEINGLTMGAVGRGTTIDHVQTSFTNDDAFEWFGGSVNCRYLVSYRDLDDCWDTDNGFSGIVQFCLALRDPSIADNPSVSTSEGFESDNDPSGSTSTPKTTAIFCNMTCVGPYRGNPSATIASGYRRAARIRRNSELKIFNSVLIDFKNGLHIDGTACETNATNGLLKFKNNIVVAYSALLEVNSGSTYMPTLTSLFSGSWNNSSYSSTAGILTAPYTTSASGAYIGDYRPATGSVALGGADFSDATLVGKVLVAPTTPFDSMHICKLTTAPTLTATALPGCTLKWWGTYAIGGTSSSTPPVVSNAVSKTYYVSQVNAYGTESNRKGIQIVVDPLVSTPTAIYGAGIDVCFNTPYKYYCSAAANATSYTWVLPANTTLVSTSGAKHDTAYISFSSTFSIDNIGVIASNNCGSSLTRLKKVIAQPGTPAKIFGDGMVCANVGGAAMLYYVTPVSGFSNYTWSVPTGSTLVSGQGSDSIWVSFQSGYVIGNIGVQTTGFCQSSLTRLLKAYVKPAILPTTMMTGSSTVCTTGATQGYKMSSVIGATGFNWVVPTGVSILNGQTTDSITVQIAGGLTLGSTIAIKAQATNSCGGSAYKSMTVTVVSCARMSQANSTLALDESNTTSLYPNPATSEFNLNYTASADNIVLVNVYDAVGRKVLSSQNTVVAGHNTITINCNKLNLGVYSVRVTDLSSNTSEVLRLVK